MTIEDRVNRLERKQEDIDLKIKSLEENIKLASMGFSVNFFK